MKVKSCSKCETPKPLEDFVKDSRRTDGRGSWCLVCNRRYMSARHQRPDVNAGAKAYYQAHKTHINAQSRRRWAENKERYALAARTWRSINREALLRYFRERGASFRNF